MGKWTDLRGKYPALPPKGDEEGYEAQVNAAVEKMKGQYQSYEMPCHVLAELKAKKGELEEEIKAIGVQVEALNRVIFEMFETRGIANVRLEGVGLVTLTDEPYPSVVDKEKLNTWLREQGLGGLIIPTVNFQTLKATIKERITEGKPLPEDDTVKVFLKTSVLIKK